MTQERPRDSVQIDVRLVQRLVADQFPGWSDLPVEPVKNSGHDNRTFHLGDAMSVRLPSAHPYAAHVETEQVWLPRLAPYLPLPIPIPLAMGEPAHGYPWHWSINRWLEGENAAIDRIDDLSQLARDLADFLNVLRSIDADQAPPPGVDNFFRGGELSVYDAQTRECVDELQDVVDAKASIAIWESALEAKWKGAPLWLHGDVAVGNLLVERGKLCAVIDFGQLAAGDPSCDVTIAWTLFSGASRETFRAKLSIDEGTWMRGRGWGLWKALLELRRYRHTNASEATKAMRVIDDILAD